MKNYISQSTNKEQTETYIEYVVNSVEEGCQRWRVVSKKQLLELNPHDIVAAYEVGRPVRVSVCVQPK